MDINKASIFTDAFADLRKKEGVYEIDDQNDPVLMLLRHSDIKETAKNYQTFSSEATPGRIVVPSEVNIRDMRQIPFELDPPSHTAYRELLNQWFKRPLNEDYKAALELLISDLIAELKTKKTFEVVTDFALVLQSRALTLLLNVPVEEAETWISWGTHVFRSEGEALDANKANVLYDYIDLQIEKATKNPGQDLYSVLLNTDFEGRKLNKEEVKGILVLTFAGGRDTIINAVTNAISYFAANKNHFEGINEKSVVFAVEELLRYFSPLTHMGRVVKEDTQVCENMAKADSRVSLCWASANRDETVFENPNEVQLDRKKNPHLSFGFGHHLCLGATHTRQILKILLLQMAEKFSDIKVISHKENIELWGDVERKVGFHELKVSL